MLELQQTTRICTFVALQQPNWSLRNIFAIVGPRESASEILLPKIQDWYKISIAANSAGCNRLWHEAILVCQTARLLAPYQCELSRNKGENLLCGIEQ